MLHGRHDRKIEESGRANHRVDPMRLARIQQNNWNDEYCAQSSAATLSKNE
jgi:hypothetical protein